jgi:glucan phosphoethanolaminetransferase (alkaline phosphatase superfamily)
MQPNYWGRSLKTPLSPHVIWASVVIVFMLIGGAVTLTLMGKDIVVILSLTAIVAVPVLTAFGAMINQKVQEVKEISNGNNSELLNMVKNLQTTVTELALKVQPPAVDSPDGRIQADVLLPPDSDTRKY